MWSQRVREAPMQSKCSRHGYKRRRRMNMSARHVATFSVTLLSLIAGNASAQHIAPSALLTIDQNRATVVDRIVNQWGDRLASSNAGVTSKQLREILSGLRAD